MNTDLLSSFLSCCTYYYRMTSVNKSRDGVPGRYRGQGTRGHSICPSSDRTCRMMTKTSNRNRWMRDLKLRTGTEGSLACRKTGWTRYLYMLIQVRILPKSEVCIFQDIFFFFGAYCSSFVVQSYVKQFHHAFHKADNYIYDNG
jgi:hypothetical protein